MTNGRKNLWNFLVFVFYWWNKWYPWRSLILSWRVLACYPGVCVCEHLCVPGWVRESFCLLHFIDLGERTWSFSPYSFPFAKALGILVTSIWGESKIQILTVQVTQIVNVLAMIRRCGLRGTLLFRTLETWTKYGSLVAIFVLPITILTVRVVHSRLYTCNWLPVVCSRCAVDVDALTLLL